MKTNIKEKILVGFFTCILILLAIAIFSSRTSQQFADSNKLLIHTHEVLYELDQILLLTVDTETGERGFIITKEDSFLEPYYKGKTEINTHINKIKTLIPDNPTQQKNIEELEKQIESQQKNLEEIISISKNDFNKAKSMVASGREKVIEDQIRKIISNAKDIEQKLLEERRKVNEQDWQDFNTITIILILLITVVLIIVYFIINGNLRAIKKAEQETDDKNWLLSGSLELNDVIRGEKDTQELSQNIIEQLCSYLKAQIGSIYLLEDHKLVLSGSYAFSIDKKNTNIIEIGQGLVGQTVLSKKSIIYTDIPDDYFKINSSLGSIKPKNLIILPFMKDGMVKGVIEIGTTRILDELDIQFLSMISENIAIVINASQSREKLKELFEETQRQAEELESQQEELREFNEGLQEKTLMLEKSENKLKKQQQQLENTNQQLEENNELLEEQKQKLKDANTDIQIKARELEVTGKYKSEFLANMSHELRTPLNSIIILSQLLSENINNVLGNKEIEFSKVIYNSGKDLLNLINEILDLSKVEAGKMELEINDIEIKEIKNNMQWLFSEQAKIKNIDFDIYYDEQLKTISTDKQKLEQILKNLLSNAFKFTDKDGKVLLSIEKLSSDVVFKNKELNKINEMIAFKVQDTGIGISHEKLEIIFDAFQQADGSTKRKYGGTGLGLSISRELANALGGEIHLESKENEGSLFTLYLPLSFDSLVIPDLNNKVVIKDKNQTKNDILIEQKIINEAKDDRYKINTKDKVILIIEDNMEFAQILLDFARQRNYKGVIALEGKTGLSYAREYKPDAIILDMKLPLMDGDEVLKELKSNPDLNQIPVQIISGYDREKEVIQLGAFDFMKKPVSKDELKRKFDNIENFINKKLKKILIVEDNKYHSEAIRELIESGDIKSYSAYSGSEALEIINKDDFDCMVVDLVLPDMSGFDLLKKIKAEEKLQKIPAIVYTGKDLSKEEAESLMKLSDTVILKTADSHERLLDETMLFLHSVESKLPKEKKNMIGKVHKTDQILKNKSVLIVDDDIRNIYSLVSVLEQQGMSCLTADNGKTAVKMIKENSLIDIVLMDIMMPIMDGYEATMEIRGISKFEKLPIIALTAKAMKDDREKGLEAGMSDYVTKPVDVDKLLSLMRVWLYK